MLVIEHYSILWISWGNNLKKNGFMHNRLFAVHLKLTQHCKSSISNKFFFKCPETPPCYLTTNQLEGRSQATTLTPNVPLSTLPWKPRGSVSSLSISCQCPFLPTGMNASPSCYLLPCQPEGPLPSTQVFSKDWKEDLPWTAQFCFVLLHFVLIAA